MTNTDHILRAALLANMLPEGASVHRYQLYYLVQGHLGHRVGTNDLQRALETATDTDGFFRNYGGKGSGRYQLTDVGWRRARLAFPQAVLMHSPATEGNCVLTLTSPAIAGSIVKLRCTDGEFAVTLGTKSLKGTDARDWLNSSAAAGIPVRGDSAPRQVYDYGILHGWTLAWLGPVPVPAVPGEDAKDTAAFEAVVEAARTAEKASIQRLGQASFREALLSAYSGACAITGFSVPEALEAAHIVPYHATASNQTRNGLLLRADVHTLFDRGLISVDPETMRVKLAESLRASEYRMLDGALIRLPTSVEDRPTKTLLSARLAILRRVGLPR
jgi:hypothetical protein